MNVHPPGSGKALTAFGLLTVLFWLSLAVFPRVIPPLVPTPTVEGMLGEVAPGARQSSPALNRPDDEVLASVRREILWAFALIWLQIGAGVLAGVLIVLRNQAGRWTAMILCGLTLAQFLVSQGRLAHDGHLIDFWRALAHYAGRAFIRQIVDVLFFSGTLVYLTRRHVAVQFARTD